MCFSSILLYEINLWLCTGDRFTSDAKTRIYKVCKQKGNVQSSSIPRPFNGRPEGKGMDY